MWCCVGVFDIGSGLTRVRPQGRTLCTRISAVTPGGGGFVAVPASVPANVPENSTIKFGREVNRRVKGRVSGRDAGADLTDATGRTLRGAR